MFGYQQTFICKLDIHGASPYPATLTYYSQRPAERILFRTINRQHIEQLKNFSERIQLAVREPDRNMRSWVQDLSIHSSCNEDFHAPRHIEGLCSGLTNLKSFKIEHTPLLPGYLSDIIYDGGNRLRRLYVHLDSGTSEDVLSLINKLEVLEILSLEIGEINNDLFRYQDPIQRSTITQFNIVLIEGLTADDAHIFPEYLSRCRINPEYHLYFAFRHCRNVTTADLLPYSSICA
jgi:hypothetical protein